MAPESTKLRRWFNLFNSFVSTAAFLASIASIVALMLYMRDTDIERVRQEQENAVQATEIAKLDYRFSVQSASQQQQLNRQDHQIAIAQTQIIQNERLNRLAEEEATVTAKQLEALQIRFATPIADQAPAETATAIAFLFAATREALDIQREQVQATQTAISQVTPDVKSSVANTIDYSNCNFFTELLKYGTVNEFLYGNNGLAGAQMRLTTAVDVPAGWIIHEYGEIIQSPRRFEAGTIASFWASPVCEPLNDN